MSDEEIKSMAQDTEAHEEQVDFDVVLNSRYIDLKGISINPLGLVLLLLLIVYCCFTPSYGVLAAYLAVVVLLHELGHYVAGRAFHCVMRKVSLFFIPAISYKHNSHSYYDPSRHTWRDTEWILGALPLGGYTSFVSSNVPPPADPRRSPFINHKPAWQRMITHAGGIIANLLTFAICLLAITLIPTDSVLTDILYRAKNLSIALAVLNLLPLYPLDGSAVLTSLYEIVTGNPPAEGFMKVFKVVGFGLMIYLFFINPDALNSLLLMIFPKGL